MSSGADGREEAPEPFNARAERSPHVGMASQCCCCFGLRSGAVVIGASLLILHTLVALIQVTVLSTLPDKDPERQLESARRLALAVVLIALLLHVVFNSALVHGARTRHRGLVLAWLVYHAVSSALHSLGLLSAFVGAAAYGNSLALVVLLITMGLLVPLWYWFAVGVRLYCKLSHKPGVVYSEPCSKTPV
ncbi:hypothetical protein FJT64_018302 [Amphibalanus amphitrite]|uniref:Uncharacterized protein n=1 Tax=Amphibalanus amphitrite TaxID=1232801 RepID=A0A6A4X3Y3_AMPAM|nr:hypothetical protein FJT64_018302 [Amphibalanus amphitrite]